MQSSPDMDHEVNIGSGPLEIDSHYDRGIDLLEAGKPAEAILEFEQSSSAHAYSQLGYLHHVGKGVVESVAKALEYYHRAAEFDLPHAHYAIAVFHLHQEEYDVALRHAQAAGLRGHPAASYWAFLLCNGYLRRDGSPGLPVDKKRAHLHLRRAAKQGHFISKMTLLKKRRALEHNWVKKQSLRTKRL